MGPAVGAVSRAGEQGQRITSGIECEAVQPGELRGSLKREWNELQQKLKQVQTTSKAEQAMLTALTASMAERAKDPSRQDIGAYLFKYRHQGKTRLLWCWGYERTDPKDCSAAVCAKADCSRVFLRRGAHVDVCPCGAVLPVKRNPFKRIAAAVLLLLAAGGVVTGICS